MLATLVAIVVALSILSLSFAIWKKRKRSQREMEEHSITAEQLHALFASNQRPILFDVRQPLDLLAYPETIPGARRVSPQDVLEKPLLIPKEEEKLSTAHARVIRQAGPFCVEHCLPDSCGSSFSGVDWPLGRLMAIQSNRIESPFNSMLQ